MICHRSPFPSSTPIQSTSFSFPIQSTSNPGPKGRARAHGGYPQGEWPFLPLYGWVGRHSSDTKQMRAGHIARTAIQVIQSLSHLLRSIFINPQNLPHRVYDSSFATDTTFCESLNGAREVTEQPLRRCPLSFWCMSLH